MGFRAPSVTLLCWWSAEHCSTGKKEKDLEEEKEKKEKEEQEEEEQEKGEELIAEAGWDGNSQN